MALLLVGLCFLFEPEGKIIFWEWSKMGDLREKVKILEWNMS